MGNCFRFVASIFRQADSLVCHQKIPLIFRYQFLRPLSYNGAQNVLFCIGSQKGENEPRITQSVS